MLNLYYKKICNDIDDANLEEIEAHLEAIFTVRNDKNRVDLNLTARHAFGFGFTTVVNALAPTDVKMTREEMARPYTFKFIKIKSKET